MAIKDELVFNGIDATSGEYSLPPTSAAELARRIRSDPDDRSLFGSLAAWVRACLARSRRRGPVYGVDPRDLATSGWGVVFHRDEKREVKEALGELLAHRRDAAGKFYRKLEGSEGYRPQDSKEQFLVRHGAGTGPADPRRLPYYLLLVGGPEKIPFQFQYELGLQYAVGRLDLPTLEDYRRYAGAVVRAERSGITRSPRLTLFGVENPGDAATRRSNEQLIHPLGKRLGSQVNGWEVTEVVGSDARRKRLLDLLSGQREAGLVLTSSHGMAFPTEDARRRELQGALLCSDWSKDEGNGVEPCQYLAAGDVPGDPDEAPLLGLVAFHFACYGAGTPQRDNFMESARHPPRRRLAAGLTRRLRGPSRALQEEANEPFVARMPQELLRRGALAVVGHVDRAWTCSFSWLASEGEGSEVPVFESTLRALMEGMPVGAALEYFKQRYGELGAQLGSALDSSNPDDRYSDRDLVRIWTAFKDARNYVVLGDPAVRVLAGRGPRAPGSRRTLRQIAAPDYTARPLLSGDV